MEIEKLLMTVSTHGDVRCSHCDGEINPFDSIDRKSLMEDEYRDGRKGISYYENKFCSVDCLISSHEWVEDFIEHLNKNNIYNFKEGGFIKLGYDTPYGYVKQEISPYQVMAFKGEFIARFEKEKDREILKMMKEERG